MIGSASASASGPFTAPSAPSSGNLFLPEPKILLRSVMAGGVRPPIVTLSPTAAGGPASTGAVTISGGGLASITPLTIFTGFTATTSLGTVYGQRTATFQAYGDVWRILTN